MGKEPKYKLQKRKALQWHPAFYAGIQIELEEEADKLVFENEHQLGTMSMTNHLNGYKAAEKLLCEYGKHGNENLYKSVMDITVRANTEIFEEANIMCDALKEIMKDELDARQEQGRQEGRQEGRKALELAESRQHSKRREDY